MTGRDTSFSLMRIRRVLLDKTKPMSRPVTALDAR